MEETTVEHTASGDSPWRSLPPEGGAWEAFGLLSERRVRRWALVLESKGIPYRVLRTGMTWEIVVPAADFERARGEIRLFEEENRNWPPSPPQTRPQADSFLAVLSVLLLTAAFHNITTLPELFGWSIPWQEAGAGDAGLIREGEWWRLVTALTLHADVAHLSGNLAIGGLFILLLCRDVGTGTGWFLLVASGTLGNLVNALLQSPTHRSVGGSTLVFGAVGILSAMNLLRYRHSFFRRWAIPAAGGVALLTMLGTEGKQTDLGAHLFGFLAGLPLGLAAELLVERYGPPGKRFGRVAGAAAAFLVGAAWWSALAHFPS